MLRDSSSEEPGPGEVVLVVLRIPRGKMGPNADTIKQLVIDSAPGLVDAYRKFLDEGGHGIVEFKVRPERVNGSAVPRIYDFRYHATFLYKPYQRGG